MVNEPLVSSNLEFNEATNLEGESLQFIVNDSSISVVGQENTVEIIVSDLIAYNGVVHVVDALINPRIDQILQGSCGVWTLELETTKPDDGWKGSTLSLFINNSLIETITVAGYSRH